MTNVHIDLATMPIADKVSSYAHARYFAAQLGAVQSEAERYRCRFVLAGCSDRMPADPEVHLSLALMLTRSAYRPPTELGVEHRACALARVADGSRQTLLRCS